MSPKRRPHVFCYSVYEIASVLLLLFQVIVMLKIVYHYFPI